MWRCSTIWSNNFFSSSSCSSLLFHSKTIIIASTGPFRGSLGGNPPTHPRPLISKAKACLKIAKYYANTYMYCSVIKLIIVLYNNFLLVYMVSEATRNSLRVRKFQNFPGGACPPDPTNLVCYHIMLEFPLYKENLIPSLIQTTDQQ